jgi:hypothetical protein
MLDLIRREWWAFAFLAVSGVVMGVSAGLGFFESINSTVLFVFWFAVGCLTLRALVMPIQYFRHSRAVSKFLRSEADLARRAGAGDAGARIRLSMAVKDPRDTPWWRW